MSIVDERGRLFGRVNLVDGAVAAFVLVLIPVAYGTMLLFRPAVPHVDSVTQVDISNAERRIANGAYLVAKLKVKGTGLNPMLRATIGGTPAVAFVFENPNSADVLVGQIPIGTHDLILMDGVQEVARAAGAVTIQSAVAAPITAVGWLTELDSAFADGLKPGYAFPEVNPAIQIRSVGQRRPARLGITLGDTRSDLSKDGSFEREIVASLNCDPPSASSPCNVGGVPLVGPTPIIVTFVGANRTLVFAIMEVFPASPPTRVRVRAFLASSPAVAMVKAGDRDTLLDQRGAQVIALGAQRGGQVVTLDLGVDDSRDGWRYRGRPVKPGLPFTLSTDRYEVTGQVISVEVSAAGRPQP